VFDRQSTGEPMLRDHHTVATNSRTNKSKITNGAQLLRGINMRSAMGRRLRDLVASYREGLGLLDQRQMQLAKSAAGSVCTSNACRPKSSTVVRSTRDWRTRRAERGRRSAPSKWRPRKLVVRDRSSALGEEGRAPGGRIRERWPWRPPRASSAARWHGGEAWRDRGAISRSVGAQVPSSRYIAALAGLAEVPAKHRSRARRPRCPREDVVHRSNRLLIHHQRH
jgi:hypothetical protein